jgi:UDP-glucose 4-epimerase
MKLLAITGATGFVGSYLTRAALDAGWKVRALVRDPARLPRHPKLEGLAWDARDTPPPHALRNVDAVAHAAAVVPPDLSDPVHAEVCMMVNAGGTLRLLQAAELAGVGRLVYFSSANCYAPSAAPVSEDAPLYPSARAPYYLASKLAGEIYVAHWQAVKRLSTCSLRVASVYGPGMPSRDVVALFTRRLRAGQEIQLHGGGRQGSDFVHVEDVAQAALASVASPVGGALNIGSGRQTTIRELATILADIVGGNAPALIRDSDGEASPSPYAGLDITRAKGELGFRPRRLEDGLAHCLADPATPR